MSEQAFNDALAEELSRTPNYTMELTGSQALQLVCFLQLALRHPAVEDDAERVTLFVRGFIASVREGFGGFPVIQMLIDKNDPSTVEMPRPC